MRFCNRATLALCACVLFVFSGSVRAEHPWPMFHRDAARKGQAAVPGPRYVDIKWIAPLGAATVANYASPVVDADGRSYIGTTDGVLHVFNSDGSPAWSYPTGATRSTSYGGSNTPSAAIADDGSVYVLDPQGSLHKLTPAGGFVWMYDSAGDTADSHPLLLPGGDIVISTYVYTPPLGAEGYLVSLQPDMTVNWEKNLGAGPVLAGPAADILGNIYVAGFVGPMGKIVKYTQAGTFVWMYDHPSHTYNTVALSDAGQVLFTDTSGFLVAIDQITKALDWEYDLGSFSQSSPAITPQGVAVSAAWTNWAFGLDLETGNPVWNYSVLGRPRAGPVVDSEGASYFALDSGVVAALDRRGKVLWSAAPGASSRSTPALDADGNLYLAAETAEGAALICFSAGYDLVKTVAGAKALPDGSGVQLPGKPVTYVGDGYFYIQDWDPIAGIRVISDEVVSVGDVVDVEGTIGLSGLERAVTASGVRSLGAGESPRTRYFTNRAAAGGTVGSNPGPDGGSGINTVGLLVETSGSVVFEPVHVGNGLYRFYIGDGSRPPGNQTIPGIQVIAPFEPGTDLVKVRGVISLYTATGGGTLSRVLVRSLDDMVDLRM